jgi:hypothetical protein
MGQMSGTDKQNVCGVLVDALDYEATLGRIIDAAQTQRPLAVAALAVHGVMTGVMDPSHRYRLNHLDIVVPDGQPVRWALNLIHGTRLDDRVYGPILMERLCEAAALDGLPIFLYGSDQHTLTDLRERLGQRFEGLKIAGTEASKFRRTSASEKEQITERIRSSGARITFVGLGCPRQEVFVYEYRDSLSMPMIAVGAAFSYHSGKLSQPAGWVQANGLEWIHRLIKEPGRLWKRYLLLNPAYVALVSAQWAGVWKPNVDRIDPPVAELLYG